jgi:REP-associated tyrosine transposase
MARAPRIQVAGGTYHVNARGVDRAPIFRDELDYRRFLRIFRHVLRVKQWTCRVYCLMTNHYHLIVTTAQANLAAGMRLLNGTHARRFNERYGRFGHVFQGRYDARLIEDEDYLREACAYVLANPVRAGLCERPEDWRWSSCYDGVAVSVVAAASASGTSHTTPSGGRVTWAENGCSCHGVASDSTPPRLPTSEPP